jgi:hypothetical protein
VAPLDLVSPHGAPVSQSSVRFKPCLMPAPAPVYGGVVRRGAFMKISLSGVWDETVRMLRANASLFIAIAGVFLFLPALVSGYLAPEPTGGRQGVGTAAMYAYLSANWPILLLVNLIGFVGNLALLILALDPDRPTVGRAIGTAFLLLPAYFVASLISGMMIAAGMIALIVPGLYLIGRLAPMGPVIVDENSRNPLHVIRRTFELTRGHGWSILSLILIVVITFWIVSLAATTVFGSIFLLLDRSAGTGGLGALLLLLLRAAIGAAFNTVLMVLLASLYRRLAVPSSNGI